MNYKDFHGGNFKVLQPLTVFITVNGETIERIIPKDYVLYISDRNDKGVFTLILKPYHKHTTSAELCGTIDLDTFTHIDMCALERIDFDNTKLNIKFKTDRKLESMKSAAFVRLVNDKLNALGVIYDNLMGEVGTFSNDACSCEIDKVCYEINVDTQRGAHILNIIGEPNKLCPTNKLYPRRFKDLLILAIPSALEHIDPNKDHTPPEYEDLVSIKKFFEQTEKDIALMRKVLDQCILESDKAVTERLKAVDEIYNFFTKEA